MNSVVAVVRFVLFAISVVMGVVASVAWSRRRRAPEASLVALLVVAAAIYCFGYSQEVAQTSPANAFFWLHVEYFGIPWIPALWLLLARKHSGLRSNLALVLTIPVITFAGQLTNSWHGLYNHSMSLVPRGPFMVVTVERGPLAWLNLAFLFVALPYGAWIILSRWRTSRRMRSQRIILAGSGLLPFLGYALYLFGLSPWGLDLAPVMLGASAIVAHFAVFRFQLFDLVPTAHSLVFNSMREAVVITDLSHRLVDFNSAAVALLPSLKFARPGDNVPNMLSGFPASDAMFKLDAAPCEFELPVNGKPEHFELRVFPLAVEEEQLGWTVMLANISAQHQLMQELRRTAETDELTGIANRRNFFIAAERECARSDRYQTPFAVMLVDLDHFKNINDHFGHAAGDRALCSLATRIIGCLRTTDLLARFGGDEFAILLPETNAEAAQEAAERVRNVANCTIEHNGAEFDTHVSIGVATHDPAVNADLRMLLEHADRALYSAKAHGRNRVSAWQPVTLPGC